MVMTWCKNPLCFPYICNNRVTVRKMYAACIYVNMITRGYRVVMYESTKSISQMTCFIFARYYTCVVLVKPVPRFCVVFHAHQCISGISLMLHCCQTAHFLQLIQQENDVKNPVCCIFGVPGIIRGMKHRLRWFVQFCRPGGLVPGIWKIFPGPCQTVTLI